jgi:hypothetical protein
MKRLTNKTLLTLVGAIVVFSAATYWHGVHRVNPKSIEDLIGRELLPAASGDEVLTFLDAHGIAHSTYVPGQNIYADIGRSTIGLFPGRINIVFSFDEHGKLISHEVKELFDAP